MRNAYELMFRHFRSELDRLTIATSTVNPADPTDLTEWNGFVTFDYDPFLPTELVEGFGHHPVMGTTYSLHVSDMMGTFVIRMRLLADAEKVRDDYVERTFTVDVSALNWDVNWDQFDNLLNGTFHKDQPSFTWLGDLYDAEPDMPMNR